MATIKHIGSKNADYGGAEKYLTFCHDEFTMKPTLDENGRLIPRENYLFQTVNCEDDFALSCIRANQQYGKNNTADEIKSHHYIISFDPRDTADHGLTVDKAQALGMEYCKKAFPSHQAIVCTHEDGHNQSGNIHVHIVINSIRIAEVERKPYMDRQCDTQAGAKHRCTASAFRYFRSEVMEMCHGAGLYQIDLLGGRKERVTEREYWAGRKGQAQLDKRNEEMKAKGLTPRTSKFETDMAKLRTSIRSALSSATSIDDFSKKLLEQGIALKESRGRFSYLTPDRTKPITARRLGDDFDKAAILAALEQHKQQAVTKKPIPTKKPSITEQLKQHQAIGRVVDIEAKRAEGKGKGYENWAKIHNLKEQAKSWNFLTQQGFNTPEELAKALATVTDEYDTARSQLKAAEKALADKKELGKALGDYHRTKPVIDQGKTLKPRKQEDYHRKHEGDYIIHEAAKRKLKAIRVSDQCHAVKQVQRPVGHDTQKDRYSLIATVRAFKASQAMGRVA